jgi:hypothetical protein
VKFCVEGGARGHLARCIPRLPPILADFKLQAAAAREHSRHKGRGIVSVTHLREMKGKLEKKGGGAGADFAFSRSPPAYAVLAVLLMIGKFADDTQAVDL